MDDFDFDYEWIVRDNKELDEKLPFLVDEAIRLSIHLSNDGVSDEDALAFLELMEEHLESFQDMTQPEIEYALIQATNEMPHAMLREHEEFDEKLPLLARVTIDKKIDFLEIGEENPDPRVMDDILEVMREHLNCFDRMSQDQIVAGMNVLLVACEITEALASEQLKDLIEKTNDDKYILKKNHNA